MAEVIKGDLDVCRTVDARRVNTGLISKTITAAEQLEIHSPNWNILESATAQSVILPDASTLPLGWEVTVQAGTSTLNVNTFDASSPVLLNSVEPGTAYKYTLVENADGAGVWYRNLLEEAESMASERYCETFDATTSWGAAVGGYYTLVVPQATHTRGVNPTVDTFETVGTDNVEVTPDELKVSATGDVSIRVVETPDCRFAGKAVFI